MAAIINFEQYLEVQGDVLLFPALPRLSLVLPPLDLEKLPEDAREPVRVFREHARAVQQAALRHPEDWHHTRTAETLRPWFQYLGVLGRVVRVYGALMPNVSEVGGTWHALCPLPADTWEAYSEIAHIATVLFLFRVATLRNMDLHTVLQRDPAPMVSFVRDNVVPILDTALALLDATRQEYATREVVPELLDIDRSPLSGSPPVPAPFGKDWYNGCSRILSLLANDASLTALLAARTTKLADHTWNPSIFAALFATLARDYRTMCDQLKVPSSTDTSVAARGVREIRYFCDHRHYLWSIRGHLTAALGMCPNISTLAATAATSTMSSETERRCLWCLSHLKEARAYVAGSRAIPRPEGGLVSSSLILRTDAIASHLDSLESDYNATRDKIMSVMMGVRGTDADSELSLPDPFRNTILPYPPKDRSVFADMETLVQHLQVEGGQKIDAAIARPTTPSFAPPVSYDIPLATLPLPTELLSRVPQGTLERMGDPGREDVRAALVAVGELRAFRATLDCLVMLKTGNGTLDQYTLADLVAAQQTIEAELARIGGLAEDDW